MASVLDQYYSALFNLSLQNMQQKIQVAQDFHGRMKQIDLLLEDDRTGIVSTILDFMVHAGTVPISFVGPNKNFTTQLQDWQNNVNKDLSLDIPRGLRNFTEQYLRERWKSSLIVTRLIWKEVDGLELPTIMYVMDGKSIHVGNSEQKLNTNEYYFGKPDTDKQLNLIKNSGNTTYIIRKPFSQNYDQYPSPYLVKRGSLYHALFIQMFLSKQAEMIQTVFPYHLLASVGTADDIKRGKGPSQTDLDKIKDQFQGKKKDYSEHLYDKGLVDVFAGDVKISELIPDYEKVLKESLTKGQYQKLLASLGMIELKGFSQTREEAILNPKVMMEEVYDGVGDYLNFLGEVMNQIRERNSGKYKINSSIDISAGVVKTFLTNEMKTLIRSWFDRGLVSQEDSLESTTDLNF